MWTLVTHGVAHIGRNQERVCQELMIAEVLVVFEGDHALYERREEVGLCAVVRDTPDLYDQLCMHQSPSSSRAHLLIVEQNDTADVGLLVRIGRVDGADQTLDGREAGHEVIDPGGEDEFVGQTADA